MASLGATEGVVPYPSWESLLKPDWISSSSVTSEDFVCTHKLCLFSLFPELAAPSQFSGSQTRARAFSAEQEEGRGSAHFLSPANGGTKHGSTDPEKKALFVYWKLLGRLKSPQVLMLLSLSALLDSTGVAEVIYGEVIQL